MKGPSVIYIELICANIVYIYQKMYLPSIRLQASCNNRIELTTVNSCVIVPGAVITFHEILHDLKKIRYAQIRRRGGGVAQEFTVV